MTTIAPADKRFQLPLSKIAHSHLLQTTYLMYQWEFRYKDCFDKNIVFSPTDVKCVLHGLTNVFTHENSKLQLVV